MSLRRQPDQFEVQERVPLAPFTTIGIGGPARFFARVSSETVLIEALRFARSHHLPVLALGGGSNLLVRDGGFAGLVVHLVIESELERVERGDQILLRVAAGDGWDDLVQQTCDEDLSGMECLAGIPGLTGGTPIQNVGAYGQEVSQTIRSVRVLDRDTETFRELSAEECEFSYRSSRFNAAERDRYIITAVRFALRRDAAAAPLRYADLQRHFGDRRAAPREVAQAVREIRRGKGMLVVEGDPDSRSAGSFFKNPIVPEALLQRISDESGCGAEQIPHWPAGPGRVKLAAAWVLERSGFAKGHAAGRVGISSRHTLALINRGGASFAELAAFRDHIRNVVQQRFGVVLEQEPVEAGEAEAS